MSAQPVEVDRIVEGVEVEHFGEPAGARLRVRTSTEMRDWQPFVADPTREESRRIATALEYKGALYAIARCRETSRGWCYDLMPWPEGELARRKIQMHPRYWQQLAEEKRQAAQERRGDRIAHALGFFIAFLPAAVQERISEEYDYDAAGWTACNSAVVGLISLVVTVIHNIAMPLAAAYGAAATRSIVGWSGEFISIYLLLDSVIRFAMVMADDNPIGLLLFEFVYWLKGKFRQPGRR